MERDFRPNRSFTAPVKVGDEISVKIEAVGEKGDGIAKKDGFVIFVPNAKTGEQVTIKVTRVLRRVGFGEIVGASSAPAEEQSEAGSQETEETQEDSEDFGEDLEK